MTWIHTIPNELAQDRLKESYRRVKGPNGEIDNILMAHSLRPHTLDGHMALYKNVLHHSGNTLSKALLEGLGVYVSLLNHCDYCVAHHSEGLRRILKDEKQYQTVLTALAAGRPEDGVSENELSMYRYAECLTRDPGAIDRSMIEAMRQAGWSDGEILEANQVIAYFAYANRTVLGLGVEFAGERLGLSPADGGDDVWVHG